MPVNRFVRRLCAVFIAVNSASCGMHVPQINEGYEGPDINGKMEYAIKDNIFCDLVRSLRKLRNGLRDGKGVPLLPDSYGVQMQLSLTVEEASSLNPSLSVDRILPNGYAAGITVGQSYSFPGSANLSSTATRTDTSYSYYNVGKISAEGKNTRCDNYEVPAGSSLLLQSDLGIETFLFGAVLGNDLLHSSRPPAKKGMDIMLDIFSYDLKFVVVTSGGVNPSYKLVGVSGGAGSSPLLFGGRTRTHRLVLTFGPGDPLPSQASVQTHFNTQLIQSLDRIGQRQ